MTSTPDDDAAREWPVISTEVLYDGRVRIFLDELRSPAGNVSEYSWVRSNPSVSVLAFDDEGRVVLVQQYRHPLRRNVLELPAGAVDRDEEPAAAALRELREETGYVAGRLEHLGTIFPNPVRQSAIAHIYVAHDLRPGPQLLDVDEVVRVVHLTWAEVMAHVTSTEPVDGSLAYAVLRWAHRMQAKVDDSSST